MKTNRGQTWVTATGVKVADNGSGLSSTNGAYLPYGTGDSNNSATVSFKFLPTGHIIVGSSAGFTTQSLSGLFSVTTLWSGSLESPKVSTIGDYRFILVKIQNAYDDNGVLLLAPTYRVNGVAALSPLYRTPSMDEGGTNFVYVEITSENVVTVKRASSPTSGYGTLPISNIYGLK